MKNWQDLVWQSLLSVLVIFLGGAILGGVLNLAATASPRMVSAIFCPAGSTAISNPDVSSNGSSISCRDQSGASVPNLTEDESIALQRKYFYRPSYLIMIVLVMGWFIWSSRRQKMRKQASL